MYSCRNNTAPRHMRVHTRARSLRCHHIRLLRATKTPLPFVLGALTGHRAHGQSALLLREPCAVDKSARRRETHLNVLLGMVPVWTQTPPSWLDLSTMHTLLPYLALSMAHFCAAGPDPTMTRS